MSKDLSKVLVRVLLDLRVAKERRRVKLEQLMMLMVKEIVGVGKFQGGKNGLCLIKSGNSL